MLVSARHATDALKEAKNPTASVEKNITRLELETAYILKIDSEWVPVRTVHKGSGMPKR